MDSSSLKAMAEAEASRSGVSIARPSSIRKEAVMSQRITPPTFRYRIKRALPLLAFADNHDAALPLHAGKVIDVRTLPEDDRFVLVSIQGQEFHAFVSDIDECCELLQDVQVSHRSRLAATHAAWAPTSLSADDRRVALTQ